MELQDLVDTAQRRSAKAIVPLGIIWRVVAILEMAGRAGPVTRSFAVIKERMAGLLLGTTGNGLDLETSEETLVELKHIPVMI